MGREMMSAGDRDHRPRLEPGSHFFFEVPWTSNSYRILIQYKSYSFLLCYSMYLFCNRTLAITAINHFDFLIWLNWNCVSKLGMWKRATWNWKLASNTTQPGQTLKPCLYQEVQYFNFQLQPQRNLNPYRHSTCCNTPPILIITQTIISTFLFLQHY